MNKYTLNDLQYKQALPLEIKVRMTKLRIREWVKEFSVDGVYVSFSGGKDSTVLLHIAREMYPNMRAIFVDTGLEYPEIREFVRTFDNVEWLRPKMNFKNVIQTYGYPFVSKEVSWAVDSARHFLEHKEEYADKKPLPVQEPDEEYKPFALIKLEGRLKNKNGESSMFNCSNWHFMLDSPYHFSSKCCNIMKKAPIKDYKKKTGRVPITAQMAEESRLRTKNWLLNGCNAFDNSNPMSNPMAFWTEQDVLKYIKQNNIKIASVYGDVVYEAKDGSLYNKLISYENAKLVTTGLDRTGCMFCGYGCHLEKGTGRFEKMKQTHPKQYDYIMRPSEEGGLNYKAVIDWMNENGNLNIRY